jgi:hypothetical protein
MTWQDITVEQFQRMYPFLSDKSLTDFEKEVKAVAFLSGTPEDKLDEITAEEFYKIAKDFKFLHEENIPGVAKTKFVINKQSYRVETNLKKLPIARWVEVKHFTQENLIPNLHRVMASVAQPEFEQYDASKHEDYSEVMKRISFVDAYQTAVFFYLFWKKTINGLSGFLEAEIKKSGKMNQSEAQAFVKDLCSNMDGFITLNESQTSKESQLIPLGTLPSLNHLTLCHI